MRVYVSQSARVRAFIEGDKLTSRVKNIRLDYARSSSFFPSVVMNFQRYGGALIALTLFLYTRNAIVIFEAATATPAFRFNRSIREHSGRLNILFAVKAARSFPRQNGRL